MIDGYNTPQESPGRAEILCRHCGLRLAVSNRMGLVASATTTAIAAAIASTTTTASASATASAAVSTATATAAAAIATTATAVALGTRFVDVHGTARDLLLIETLYCRFGFIFIRHFDEAKTARPAGLPIHDDANGRYLAKGTEGISNIIFRCIERQITNVDVNHNRTSSAKTITTNTSSREVYSRVVGKAHRSNSELRFPSSKIIRNQIPKVKKLGSLAEERPPVFDISQGMTSTPQSTVAQLLRRPARTARCRENSDGFGTSIAREPSNAGLAGRRQRLCLRAECSGSPDGGPWGDRPWC